MVGAAQHGKKWVVLPISYHVELQRLAVFVVVAVFRLSVSSLDCV